MTIKDAIFVLNCVEAHNGICNEAKEMAIKSLEAWDKVKKEIDGLMNDSFSDSYDNGVLDCLELIDKHLSEVSE